MSRNPRMRALATILPALAVLLLCACSSNTRSMTGDAPGGRTKPASIGENTWRYILNRTFDFTDVFQLGLGLNVGSGVCMPTEPGPDGKRQRNCAEVGSRVPINPYTAIFDIGTYVGAYVQATDYVKLGHLWFAGYVLEWDGRGFYAGPERRARMGFLPWEMMYLDQVYDVGHENYFKTASTLWSTRMSGDMMTWRSVPAKELHYEFWANSFHMGIPPFYRGWQHWATVSGEVDAMFVHARAGVDLTEPFDFVLGILGIDFKHDDLKLEEYRERRDLKTGEMFVTKPKPAVNSY